MAKKEIQVCQMLSNLYLQCTTKWPISPGESLSVTQENKDNQGSAGGKSNTDLLKLLWKNRAGKKNYTL